MGKAEEMSSVFAKNIKGPRLLSLCVCLYLLIAAYRKTALFVSHIKFLFSL